MSTDQFVKFSIVPTNNIEPVVRTIPVDPLQELSSFERGLKEYCRDLNQWIEFRIGPVTTDVELYQDIQGDFDSLRSAVSSLAAGDEFTLSLPEVQKRIILRPCKDSVLCQFKGIDASDQRVRLDEVIRQR